MSQRELCSLKKDSATVLTSRLRSSHSLTTMKSGELEDEVTRLRTLLEEARADALEKERQLVELEDTCAKRLEEAEVTFAKKVEDAEVTFERRRSEDVAVVEKKFELRRLRKTEVLRLDLDRERRLWVSEKEEWTDWKAKMRGEKKLLLRVAELEREKAASTSRRWHSTRVRGYGRWWSRCRKSYITCWDLAR